MSDPLSWSGRRRRPARRTVALLAVASLIVPGATGCSPQPFAPTASPAGTPVASPSVTPSATVPAGRPLLGIISRVSTTSPVTVEVTPVEMLVGDEAIAQAREDNSPALETDEDGKDFLPNDYYLHVFDASQRRTLPLSPTCVITVVPEDGSLETDRTVTPAELAEIVAVYERLMEVGLNATGTEITSLTEVYLP